MGSGMPGAMEIMREGGGGWFCHDGSGGGVEKQRMKCDFSTKSFPSFVLKETSQTCLMGSLHCSLECPHVRKSCLGCSNIQNHTNHNNEPSGDDEAAKQGIVPYNHHQSSL